MKITLAAGSSKIFNQQGEPFVPKMYPRRILFRTFLTVVKLSEATRVHSACYLFRVVQNASVLAAPSSLQKALTSFVDLRVDQVSI